MSASAIVPSRPIFSSRSKTDSSVTKNQKKRKKNEGKVKKGGKKKKNANKGTKEPKDDREANEDSDVDIDKELKPIGDYINNRELMLEHVFKSVKEHKLQSLLPDILKDIGMDELKIQCCHQLEGMSKKRIRHILAGEEMDSSSGTEESVSDDNKMMVDEDKQMDDRTSPDTSTVVHSTCDSQGEGDYRSVGSTQDEVNAIVATPDHSYGAQVNPEGRNEDDLDECSLKSENENEEMEEDKESVTSEELEEGSEEGEVRPTRHEIYGLTPVEIVMDNEKNTQVSGNFFEEGDKEGEAGTEPSENIVDTGIDLTNIQGGNLKINISDQSPSTSKPSTDQSASTLKPSSELEILELELRARAIRSLMQKVAQNKENK
ncbi:uncharacterized protein LOC117104568 isoform X2 [Anneissia japonica]|uniref:uncharacterized protein LOC117104568 isoform X2 n=1 Tax=Anneissia japonica TaxID=1529436 RepID=UPI0014256C05|nr:uncharacterized protein LOC117104568 isoform X2 [Anneissia japonica]